MSWLMRKLNEFIARRANREDECTGRFREGRFKSQALLDESALSSCIAYVDLNPIRSGICATPETSDFTSIQERLDSYQHQTPAAKTLCTFKQKDEGNHKKNPKVSTGVLPLSQEDYFQLVDETGRIMKADKKSFIPAHLAPILSRVSINPETWLDTVKSLGQDFSNFIGRSENIEAHPNSIGLQRIHGRRSAEKYCKKSA